MTLNQHKYVDIAQTGMPVLQHRYYEPDAEQTLHFCLVYRNHYNPTEYLVDIDHCGRYEHCHTTLRLIIRKTRPLSVLVLGYSVLPYAQLQRILAELQPAINALYETA